VDGAGRLPIWVIGTYAMNFVKPVQMFLSGTYNRCVKIMELPRERVLLHFVGRVFVWSMCHAWPFLLFPVWKVSLRARVRNMDRCTFLGVWICRRCSLPQFRWALFPSASCSRLK
jgi:hypothetical protein